MRTFLKKVSKLIHAKQITLIDKSQLQLTNKTFILKVGTKQERIEDEITKTFMLPRGCTEQKQHEHRRKKQMPQNIWNIRRHWINEGESKQKYTNKELLQICRICFQLGECIEHILQYFCQQQIFLKIWKHNQENSRNTLSTNTKDKQQQETKFYNNTLWML